MPCRSQHIMPLPPLQFLLGGVLLVNLILAIIYVNYQQAQAGETLWPGMRQMEHAPYTVTAMAAWGSPPVEGGKAFKLAI